MPLGQPLLPVHLPWFWGMHEGYNAGSNSGGLTYISYGQPYSFTDVLGRTNYVGVAAALSRLNNGWDTWQGVFTTQSRKPPGEYSLSGSSNTLMFGETLGGASGGNPGTSFSWMGVGALGTAFGMPAVSTGPWTFSSNHTGGIINFAFCDGSVRVHFMVPGTSAPGTASTNSVAWKTATQSAPAVFTTTESRRRRGGAAAGRNSFPGRRPVTEVMPMRFSAFLGAGLVACALFAVGCNRNNKAEVPANPEPPPAMRPGAAGSPAPAVPLPPR